MTRLLSFCALLIPTLLHAQGFSPEEAVKRMKVPEGFTVKCVAHEPMIRQPISVSFDERGRMWVLQYLQYPNPAGLKALKQDQYLRTIWDRVPEPPPKGPKGLDKLTICYDPDENGTYRKSKDFVTGLNLASGFCIGNGGVYILQSPYLLFYPDKNRDDIPDGDPEVLLKGFGFDDTHSVANSLQWGPDGWLYGAAGSTSTCKIKNPAWRAQGVSPGTPEYIEFQQGIWRYHPKTKQFELFSEGGGNTFGLDFDKHGQAIAGTNWGGKAMLHQMQGAYYVKGFSKHGPLHNPHAYGYFDHVPYEGFVGGHVTCGGIIYQGDTYPKEYQDQYIAGNLLSSALYWHKMTPKGSSFTAKHGGDFLIANDTWFRPVDCFQGPDGSVYVADWYDKRAAHLDPIDNWDKTNGRIYKVEYKGTKQPGEFDLGKKTSAELVELLKHPNKWWRNEARRLLAEKGADKDVIAKLKKWAVEEKGVLALEALWTVFCLGAFDGDLALSTLSSHPDEYVRVWSMRLIPESTANGRGLGFETAKIVLAAWAAEEKSPAVLCQLAATAKKLAREQHGGDIAAALLRRDNLPDDPALDLMIWWAAEAQGNGFKLVTLPFVAQHGKPTRTLLFTLERMERTLIASTSHAGAVLDALLPRQNRLSDDDKQKVATIMRGLDLGLSNLTTKETKLSLLESLKRFKPFVGNDPLYARLLVRLGDEPTYQTVLKQANDPKTADAERLKKLELLAEIRKPEALPLFLDLFQNATSEPLRLAALNALQGYADPQVGETALALFPKLTGNFRQKTQAMLLSRKETALALLQLVDKGTIKPTDLTVDQLRPLLAFDDPAIGKIIVKHWGKIGAATAGEKRARITWLGAELNRGAGNLANGKVLFTKHCAVCHTMFGEGGKIGPDLTTADRKNREYLLTHIVDPSLYVRPEFISFNVNTLDGRKLTGLVSAAESNEGSITLVNVIDNKPVKTTINKKDIDDMLPSAISLMPEKLLDTLEYQEIRDLFAYMQSEEKAPKKDAPNAKPKEKLKVLLISGSLEYKSDESLAAFQKYVEANYPVECSRAFRKADDDIPGLEALETCDVAVFFTRRLTIKGDQLERIKKYALSGKPIVAIRTASHGFQNWLEMDKEVLGGNYKNHYGAGPKCEVRIADSGKEHPVLKNVKPFASTSSLYKNPDIAKDAVILMTGAIPDHIEPVTWVRDFKGGRVFYTSLGHPDDFKDAGFVRMLVNALFWTAKKEIPSN